MGRYAEVKDNESLPRRQDECGRRIRESGRMHLVRKYNAEVDKRREKELYRRIQDEVMKLREDMDALQL